MNGFGTRLKIFKNRLAGKQKEPAPQLIMYYTKSQGPRKRPLPQGYSMRSYRLGDEDAWAELLQINGQLGTWNRARVKAQLQGNLVVEAQFFVVYNGQLVATSGLYDRLRQEIEHWEIGWIATHPDHQGKGLGREVVGAAVRAARSLHNRPVFLLTDDFRIAALKLYLKLGFVPDYKHPSYRGRWQAIFSQLGEDYAQYNNATGG